MCRNLNAWDVFWMNQVQIGQSVEWKKGCRFLFNVKDLKLKCARVLHEYLDLVPILMYGSETMMWKEKDWSKIRVVQMDNLRGLLGIRITELCGVTKWVNFGLMNVFSMWREWRMIEFLRGST